MISNKALVSYTLWITAWRLPTVVISNKALVSYTPLSGVSIPTLVVISNKALVSYTGAELGKSLLQL